MTTTDELLRFLEIYQQTPVIDSPYATNESRRRVQTDRMRLRQLPAASIVRYVEHGAACDTPERMEANQQFESEGFASYRILLPIMRRLFPDVCPHDESQSS